MKQMQTRWTSQTLKSGEFVEGDILITTSKTYEILSEIQSAEDGFCQFVVCDLETLEGGIVRISADDDSCVIVRSR